MTHNKTPEQIPDEIVDQILDKATLTSTEKPDTTAQAAQLVPSSVPAVSPSKYQRYFWRRWFALLSLFLLLIALISAWILRTNSGTRFLLQTVQSLSGGQVRFSGIEGRLLDQLHIDELTYQSATQHVNLSGLDLEWSPSALLRQQLAVTSLKISTLRLASVPDNQPLVLPQNLQLPLAVDIQQLAIGRLSLAQLQSKKTIENISLEKAATEQTSNQQEQITLSLNAISGSIRSTQALHQMVLNLQSEWGGLALKGEVQTNKPYRLNADVAYTGQARTALPAISLQGKLSGDLQVLRLQAHSPVSASSPTLISAVSKNETPKNFAKNGAQDASAVVDVSVAPFAKMPLLAAKVQVEHLDPRWLSAAAPQAMLSLNIDLRAAPDPSVPSVPSLTTDTPASIAVANQSLHSSLDKKTAQKKSAHSFASATTSLTGSAKQPEPPTINLVGQIQLKNSAPQTWDKQGIPVRTLRAQLHWRDQQLVLTNNLLEVGNGKLEGNANLHFANGTLPQFDAKLLLSDINLAQIDSRLRSTQIKGKLALESKADRRIDFQAQLSDPRASLNSDASFIWNQNGDGGLVNLKNFELLADQSRFSGSAELNLDGKQAFKLAAKLEQFNPAHWAKVPAGRIDAELNVSGTLLPKPQLQLSVPNLSGELAGHKLLGAAELAWRQDNLFTGLKVGQLNLSWGANVLSAQGQLGNDSDVLQVKLQAENLALFEAFSNFSLGGKATLDADVRGKLNALTVKGKFAAAQLKLPDGLRVGQVDADFNVGTSSNGPMDLVVTAHKIYSSNVSMGDRPSSSLDEVQATPEAKRRHWLELLNLQVQGQRDAHKLQATAQFTPSRQLKMQASGALDWRRLDAPLWRGQLEQMQLSGLIPAANQTATQTANHTAKQSRTTNISTITSTSTSKPNDADLSLLSALPLELSAEKISVGAGKFGGGLGQINLQNFEWTPQSMLSKGNVEGLPILDLLQVLQPQERFAGDLKLGVQWDLQLKDHLRAQLNVQRQRGDLQVLDADGTGQKMDLGLSNLQLSLNSAGLLVGTDAEKIRMQAQMSGTRLGNWNANLDTQIRKLGDKWTFTSDAPLQGELHASVPELQWLVSQFSSEFSLKGALNADAKFSGSFDKPLYKATLEGKGLEFAFASEGLLFPNGELKAELNEQTLKLMHLRFSNKVAFVPKQEPFQDLNWVGKQGEFNATGEVNWHTQAGAIQANWQTFPLLQRKDRWLVVSGQASITQLDKAWTLIGKLKADAAYFKLPKMPPPSLSGDVLLSTNLKLDDQDRDQDRDKALDKDAGRKALRTKLDLQIDMGSRFLFVGRGLNTALAGTLRLRGTDSSPMHASGSITTNGGQYEGYGQQLEIERGILNFQGAPENPSLNIRALRKGLAVEAGVDVTGTVANPQVRLVSEPNVPDSDKISWLVLGRESDQVGSADASLLLSAAGAIFGGDGSRNIPKELVQSLGFDEFSIGPSENGGASKLPSQTVAGATDVGASSNDKVVRIGWRMRPGLVLAVERGMSDASGALKLSWQLSRRIRMIGSFGTDNSVDMKYKFSFN